MKRVLQSTLPRSLPGMLFAIIAIVTAAVATTAAQADDDSLLMGQFTGMNNHATSGEVRIVETANGIEIQLGEDFSFDGAPDPKIALGKDGTYDASTLIRALDANTGAQSYLLPKSIDIADYNEVYVWCERYAVGLGVAALQ